VKYARENNLPLAFALAVLKPNTKLAASQRKLVAVGRCRDCTERRGALKLRQSLRCLPRLGWRKSADWLDLSTRAGGSCHDINWRAGAGRLDMLRSVVGWRAKVEMRTGSILLESFLLVGS
jgi:hypothetical protein